MKILVGLSGGVDSTVTALMLKQQGHEVIGATMSISANNNMTPHSDFRNGCYSPHEKEDIQNTRKLAADLDIPFHVIDCSDAYENIVLENFKSEYIKGRTPNPCIRCNPMIKFGLFPELARKNGIEFDKFATGHYTKIEKGENGRWLLKRGFASHKDQSYFLYRLTQEQLSRTIFPLGEFTKEQIREFAKENGLKVAEKPDSQDFYDGDYNELLGVNELEGNIVNTEGKILGKHKGIWNYTIGQRKGLCISAPEPLYVVELKKETNEVVVGYADKTFKSGLIATDLNWIGIDGLNEELRAQAKIRSTQQPVDVTLSPTDNGVQVVFNELQKSIAIGQSVVFYDNDSVLGGGIIDSSF